MIIFIYDLLYVIPFCLTVLIFSRPYLKIGEFTDGYFLFSVLLCIVCELYFVLKAKGRIILSGIILSIGLAVFLLFYVDAMPEVSYGLSEFCLLFIEFAVSFFLSRMLINFRKLRLVSFGSMLLALILSMIFSSGIDKNGTYCVLFLCVVSVLEEIQLHWKKSGYTEPKKHLVSISPFILILFISIVALPVPETPYEWNWVKNIVSHIEESYRKFRQELEMKYSEDYFVNKIGFSDRGRLSDELESDTEEMLQVTVSDVRTDSLYLSGKVFDTFVNGEWINTNTSTENDRMLDTLESLCVASIFMKDTDDFMKKQSIKVKYTNMKTQYMFVPEKMIWGLAGFNGYNAIPYANSFVFNEKKGYDTEYELQYYVINHNPPMMHIFMTHNTSFDSRKWNVTTGKFRYNNPELYTYDKLLQHREKINEVYLPETKLSAELREVMDEILKDCTNDSEKLSMIEGMLKSFDYTENPGWDISWGINPDSFLDELILHRRCGYCSYFATAFVLLARAEGIPARYVQGYYIPVGTEKTISVSSDMAHAWAEVYFEGKGWIAYEPTPGYQNAFTWSVEEKEDIQNPFNSSLLEKYGYEKAGADYADNAVIETEEDEFEFRWYIVVLPVVFLLLILFFVFIFEKLINEIRFRSMDGKEQVLFMCRKNMKVLKYISRIRYENETLSEYSCALASDMEAVKSALSFIDIYEHYLYSDISSVEGALKTTKGCLKSLEQELKNRSRIKYYIYFFLMH